LMQLNKVFKNPTVLTLGMISLFCDIAGEMLYPVIPIFLTTTLGASMVYVGIIEGVAEAISSLLKGYAGHLSDKWQNRKDFIRFGYALSAISKPLIGLAVSWPMVLFARGLDRTGKGIRTAPRDALLSDSVDSHLQGAAFGWHRFMDTLGAVIGPLLAIALLAYYKDNLRDVFFWAIIPGVVTIALSFLIKDRPKKILQTPISFSLNGLPSDFKKYLMAWGIFSLGNSSDVFLIMRAKESGLSNTAVILLYCLFNLTYATSSPYLGIRSDRTGRKNTLLLGLITFSLVYSGFILCSKPWEFVILFAVYGLFMAGTEGIGKAYAIDLMPADQKATGVGILTAMTGLCTLVASVLGGILWEHVSFKATFFLAALMSMIAVFTLSTIEDKISDK